MTIKSFILVTIQFASLGYILLSGSIIPNNILLLLTELLGVAIGFLALWNMLKSKLRVQPQVHPEATLVNRGIYKVVRHPMYLAFIFTLLPLVINSFSYFRLAVLVLLVINLVLKILYEEQLLEDKFGNYQEVFRKTWRLIPFVW